MRAQELRQAAATLREDFEREDVDSIHKAELMLELASWLEDIAAGWMWDGEEPNVVDFDGDRLTFEESLDTRALRIARLINGSA